MSELLSNLVCNLHPERPASFRCQSCRGYFCPECVTEHDNKYTCASCLDVRKEEASPVERRFSLQPMPLIQFAMAVVFCWVIFYLLAQLIVGVPDKFHEGTLWE